MSYSKLTLIFGSRTKAQEILLLQHDAKPVVRQGFYESELPRVEKFCRENYFHLVKSTFKVLLADEGENYSNKGIRIAENDRRPGMFFVYISKSEEKAWQAAYQEMMNNHQELGLTLGYPSCCVGYFCQNFSAIKTNPLLKPTNLYTNLTQRDKDCVLISHFPCSSECPASVRMAQNNLSLINKIDKNRGKEMRELLEKGVISTSLNSNSFN